MAFCYSWMGDSWPETMIRDREVGGSNASIFISPAGISRTCIRYKGRFTGCLFRMEISEAKQISCVLAASFRLACDSRSLKMQSTKSFTWCLKGWCVTSPLSGKIVGIVAQPF